MKFSRLSFQMRKNQFIGLGILGILIVICQLVFSWIKKEKKHQPISIEWVQGETVSSIVLSKFNPNELSIEEWQKIGFSEKQAQTILKYKDLVGGAFLSKEQLAKCYAISTEKFKEIEPYVLLPKTHQRKEEGA